MLPNMTHGEMKPMPAVTELEAAADFQEVTFMTPFDYLFEGITADPASHLPADQPAAVVAGLKLLGDAMIEQTGIGDDNSSIPPIYTYWGQFIDHDITANTDRPTQPTPISDIRNPALAPLAPDQVVELIANLRQPTLNLDSVYGEGPADTPELYDGIRLLVGTNAPAGTGEVPPPAGDLHRDLPREAGRAVIADGRNDENLIIAQFHTAFLRFHNAAVDWVEANETPGNDDATFERARQLTRWHYQWLVVHDYLRTVTAHGTVDRLLIDGPAHYAPRDGELFMPLEFSVAGFRFGHTMVRPAYDLNRTFGRGVSEHTRAPFAFIFQSTGGGFPAPFGGVADALPADRIIEWDRLIDHGSAHDDRFTRKIDTRLAPPLATMLTIGNDEPNLDIRALVKHLAKRNLLRGYQLSLPTGQAVADALGVEPLTEAELLQGRDANVAQVLTMHGFTERTPLWFYLLKEAEVRAGGNSLGEAGSRLIGETIVGLIEHDPDSFLNHPGGWSPADGVRLSCGRPIVTIGDFLRFAGVLA